MPTAVRVRPRPLQAWSIGPPPPSQWPRWAGGGGQTKAERVSLPPPSSSRRQAQSTRAKGLKNPCRRQAASAKRTGGPPSACRAQAGRVPGGAQAMLPYGRETRAPPARPVTCHGERAGGVLAPGSIVEAGTPRWLEPRARPRRPDACLGSRGRKAGECEMPLARGGGPSGQPCPPRGGSSARRGEGSGVRCVASPRPLPACCLSISCRVAGPSTRAAPWL